MTTEQYTCNTTLANKWNFGIKQCKKITKLILQSSALLPQRRPTVGRKTTNSRPTGFLGSSSSQLPKSLKHQLCLCPSTVEIWPLATCLMLKFCISLPHQRSSTTVSLETKPASTCCWCFSEEPGPVGTKDQFEPQREMYYTSEFFTPN